jgi:hypothetical protein
MSGINKVLWGDGQFLRPQHFQQQDIYHEQRLHRRAQLLHPYGWGVAQLDVDRDALASGSLRLLELSLVFADGEQVQAPGSDALPDAIDLSSLPPGAATPNGTSDGMLFHATLPSLKPFGGNVLADNGGGAARSVRYLQRNVATSDLFTGAAPADIGVLSRMVRLLPDGEHRDACVSLPLVRVRRRPSGGFEIDPDFVPPSLSLPTAPSIPARSTNAPCFILPSRPNWRPSNWSSWYRCASRSAHPTMSINSCCRRCPACACSMRRTCRRRARTAGHVLFLPRQHRPHVRAHVAGAVDLHLHPLGDARTDTGAGRGRALSRFFSMDH